MRTYERIFQHVKPSYLLWQNGHALRNIENKESLKKAKSEIEKMLNIGLHLNHG